VPATIDWRAGRVAFGDNPAGYHAARPSYHPWVFAFLEERHALRAGQTTFEVGAGTGIATAGLLGLGADPLVAIEPDARLVEFLRASLHSPSLSVLNSTFEDALLPSSTFDLGFCGDALHWLDEDFALARAADLIRPGGIWAAAWNTAADPWRRDAFCEATTGLFNGGPASPAAGTRGIPFALDAAARVAALERNGAFTAIEHRSEKWSLVLDAEQTVALYATFSDVNFHPDRQGLLDAIARIAREQFDNRVVRNVVTSLYVARRR
jgi:SAM-dependent methyltransferase